MFNLVYISLLWTTTTTITMLTFVLLDHLRAEHTGQTRDSFRRARYFDPSGGEGGGFVVCETHSYISSSIS